MSIRHRIVGLCIIAVLLVWMFMGSGDLAMFFDPTSLIAVVGLVIGGLWFACGPRRIWAALMVAFGRDGDRDDAARVFDAAYPLSWGVGVVTMLTGLVIMLRNMDDPSAVGPSMGVALLAPLYGAALADLIFNPLRAVVAAPPDSPAPQRAPSRIGHAGMATSVIIFVLLGFFIQLVSMSEIKKEDDWRAIVQQVQEAFGTMPTSAPDPELDFSSLHETP